MSIITREEIKNKEDLKRFTKQVMTDEELAQVRAEFDTFNEFLKYCYDLTDQELNTFAGWKKSGYRVKKGSKAFTFWSKPKKSKIETQNVKTGEEEETEQEQSFFYICKLFTFNQV